MKSMAAANADLQIDNLHNSWCGLGCQSCNINTGCEICPGEVQNQGWVTLDSNGLNNTYQDFGVCTVCSDPNSCDLCSNQNTSICTSCSYPVSQRSEILGEITLQCSPQKTSNVTNDIFCEIFDLNDLFNCLKCKSGFYLNSSVYNNQENRYQTVCQPYVNRSQCLDANDKYDCANCIYGYNTFSVNDTNLCYSCQFNGINPEAIRCSLQVQANQVVYSSTIGCMDSFVDPNTGLCTSNCGIGRYGETIIGLRGMIESSTCRNCDDSCYECAGSEPSMCISCNQGFYLEKEENSLSYGTCFEKSGELASFTVYVAPMGRYYYGSVSNGSRDFPLYSITDALIMAEELGAPFLECEVEIILIEDDLPHAMVMLQPMGVYQPIRSDKYSQTTIITITSESRETQVTVLYKLRDTFNFKVGAELTNVLSLMEGPSFSLTFMKILYWRPHPLLNQNFIELNDFGGYVEMDDVSFENLNSCGSIIRNKRLTINKTYSSNLDLEQLYVKKSNDLTSELLNRLNTFPSDFNPFQDFCSNNPQSSLPPCFSIKVDQITVSKLNSMKSQAQVMIAVDPDYKMQYTGSIFDLDNFKGPIIVKQSTFSFNFITYKNCTMAKKLFSNQLPTTDNYPSLGPNKSKFHLRSLFSIVNHQSYSIDFVNNQFDYNSASNSLIYLDIAHRESYEDRVMIVGNTFTYTAGFSDATVIKLRHRTPANIDYQEYVANNETQICNGFVFQGNNITGSLGCSGLSGGAIKFECVNMMDKSDQANDKLTLKEPSALIQSSRTQVDYDYLVNDPILNDVVEYDWNHFSFKNNIVSLSTVSSQHGAVNILNYPRIEIENVTMSFIFDKLTFDRDFLGDFKRSQILTTTDEYTFTNASSSNFDENKLGCGAIKIYGSSQLSFNNIEFRYNEQLQPSYSKTRADLLYIDQHYGLFNFGIINIEANLGIYGTTDDDSYFDDYYNELHLFSKGYATIHPQIRISETSNANIKGTDKISGTFKNIQYFMVQENTDSSFLINYNQNDILKKEQITLDNLQIQSFRVTNKARSIFNINSKSLIIQNSQIEDFQIHKGYDFIDSAMFNLQLRRPFLNSENKEVIDNVLVQNCSFSGFYNDDLSRIFSVSYADIQEEIYTLIEYDQPQVIIKESHFTSSSSQAPALVAQFNAEDMIVHIDYCEFNGIQSQQLDSDGVFINAGVMQIVALKKLILSNLFVMNNAVQNTNNSQNLGSFLYVDDLGLEHLEIVITDSNFEGFSSQNKYMKSSAINQDTGSNIYINLQNAHANVTIERTTFRYFLGQGNGPALQVLSNEATINLNLLDLNFNHNVGQNGGAIYLSNINLEMQNIEFNQNNAGFGGSIFVDDMPGSQIIFSNIRVESSYSLLKGSFAYVNDVKKDRNLEIIFISTDRELYSYSNLITFIGSSALLYVNTINNLEIYINDTKFANISSQQQNGGFITINDNFQKNFKLQVQNSNINSLNHQGYGGFLRLGEFTQQVDIHLINSNFQEFFAIQNTLFEISSQDSISLVIENCTFINIQANNSLPFGSLNAQKSINLLIDRSTQFTQILAFGGNGFAQLTSIQQNTITFKGQSNIEGALSNYGLNGLISSFSKINKVYLLEEAQFKTIYPSGQGGLITLQGVDNFITINSAKFNSFYSSQIGGIFKIVSENNTEISIVNKTILNAIQCANDGCVFYIDSKTVQINIENMDLRNLQSQNSGSFIYISSLSTEFVNYTMTTSKIAGIYTKQQGSLFYIDEQSQIQVQAQVKLTNNNIQLNNTIANSNGTPNLTQSIPLTGSLVFIGQNIDANISSVQNVFWNASLSDSGSIFYLNKASIFVDTQSTFSSNLNFRGNIYCDGCSMTLNQSRFFNNSGNYGALVFMNNSAQVIFESVYIENISTQSQGGAIFSNGTGQSSLKIINLNSFIGLIQANKTGGFIHANNSDLVITIQSSSISNTYSRQEGGFIYAEKLSKLNITNSSIVRTKSDNQGQLLYSNFSDLQTFLTFSTFNGIYKDQLSDNQLAEESNYRNNSFIYLNGTQEITSINNTYQYCNFASIGGVFTLINTSIVDNDSQYFNVSANQGGVFYLYNSNLSQINPTFKNVQARYGGVYYAYGSQILQIENLKVVNIQVSYDGGIIHNQISDEDYSNITLTGNLNLDNIRMYNGMGGFGYLEGKNINLDIQGIVYANNFQSFGKAAFLYYECENPLILQKMNLNGIVSLNTGSVLISTKAKHVILQDNYINCINDTFEIRQQINTYANFKQNYDMYTLTQYSGGAFLLQNQDFIHSINNNYTNCMYGLTGGVFSIKNTQLKDLNSTYTNNSAFYGGAVYGVNSSLEFENTQFVNNFGAYGGGLSLIDYSNVTLTNISVNGSNVYEKGGFIHVDIYSNLYQENEEIPVVIDIMEDDNQENPEVFIKFLNGANIYNTSAENYGGLIYSANSNLQILFDGQISLFNSSTQGSGGIIYIDQAKKLLIRNCVFTEMTSINSGSLLFSKSESIDIEIYNNIFNGRGQPIEYQDITNIENSDLNPLSPIGVQGRLMITVINNTNVLQSYNNTYQYNYNDGSIYYLQNSSLNESASIYQNNVGPAGVAVYSIRSTVIVRNTTFINNTAFNGLFYSYQVRDDSVFENLTFQNNNGRKGSSFYFDGPSEIDYPDGSENILSITIENILLQDVISYELGGAFIYANYRFMNFYIQNIYLLDTFSYDAGNIFIEKAYNLYIQNVTSIDIKVPSLSGGLLKANAINEVHIYNVTIDCNSQWNYELQYNETLVNNEIYKLPFFTIENVAGYQIFNVVSNLVNIQNCQNMKQAIGFSISGVSFFQDSDSIYNFVQGKQLGVYSFKKTNTLLLFSNNYTNIRSATGAVINLGEMMGKISIENVKGINLTTSADGGFLNYYTGYVFNTLWPSLNLENSKFVNLRSYGGGSLMKIFTYLEYIKPINVENITVDNSYSKSDGIISIVSDRGQFNLIGY
eukprot:403347666